MQISCSTPLDVDMNDEHLTTMPVAPSKLVETHLKNVSNRVMFGIGLYRIMNTEEQAYFVRKERFHSILEMEDLIGK